MTFEVDAAAYDRFMGRFAAPLAAAHLAELDLGAVVRALDVGCGPGAMTARLAGLFGAQQVAAVDPSDQFAAAAAARFPGADVRVASAESLPFEDGSFGLTVAQLVVPFMADAGSGIAEMVRVTGPGGIVSASAWDHGGRRSPLAPFWRAVREFDPAVVDESGQFGTHEGELETALRAAGLTDVVAAPLTASVALDGPDDYWQPFTLGVGPAGAYVDSLDDADRDALRDRCFALLPPGPFGLEVTAWVASGRRPAT